MTESKTNKRNLDEVLLKIGAKIHKIKSKKEIDIKFSVLMKKYQLQMEKKAFYGLKITKKFKKWIIENHSLENTDKELLLEYCDDYEKQLPRLRIEELQEIAKRNGGKCLSTEFVSANSKLKWQCKQGHEWKATPAHIKGGTWCPECGFKKLGPKRLTLEEMQEIATGHGGKCISDEYINNRTKLIWQCKEGHEWKATPANIKSGSWCPECANENKQLTIAQMQEIARQNGGNCLSNEYVDALTKLKWQCKEGHEWQASPNNIKRGHWCPKCGDMNKGLYHKSTIKEMQEIARQRGGKCQSNEYFNNQTKLIWQCKEGHEWQATPAHIKRGKWCPECSDGISERICRKVIETIFNKEFPKSRPDWLRNNRGNQMELDGYNKELALAFEYQGIQHYEYNPHFFKSVKEFQQRKDDDKLKIKICKENGVTLIEIPYKIEYDQMRGYIINKCKKKNINVSKINKKITYRELYIYSHDKLEKMQEIASNHGGKCQSTEYINAHTKLEWQCKEGHNWKATPANIKSGRWCPECANKRKGPKRKLS